MRSIVLGAGAIGGVVGGLLARAGREVVLVARGPHLAALRDRGLRVDTPDGSFVVNPPTLATGEPFAWRPDDAVLLATKTQDADAALRALAAPPDVPVLCLTNGVEAERIALRHARDVYGGCVFLPGTHLEPGVVQVWAAPVPGTLDIGRYPDGTGEHGDALVGELLAAGLDSVLRPTIMKWKRGKLLANLANGAEALCGPTARTSSLATLAKTEGRACFAAAGLSCITETEAVSRQVPGRPIAGATRTGGSTWQSLARGASALETDYLNGEIVLLGRLHGVPTPINLALQRLAAQAARDRLLPGSLSLADLEARVAALT